jgi:hypothetical protein
MKKIKYKYLPYETIERIVTGDTEAITDLVAWYMPYIKKLSQSDKETEDRVIARLMNAAMRFKLDYEG